MKIQLLMGLGALLLVVSGLLMGVAYLDWGHWPPLTDIRWITGFFGLLLLLIGRVLYTRAVARGNRFHD